jgi:class I fructose-bisphosphate aldolase
MAITRVPRNHCFANRLGVTLEADIIKQKMPDKDGAFRKFKFGKENKRCMKTLVQKIQSIGEIQVMNVRCKIMLLNSGGESSFDTNYQVDLQAAVEAAVI